MEGLKTDHLPADKGYDSDDIRAYALENVITPHIPLHHNRLGERLYDADLLKSDIKLSASLGT